MPNIYPKIKFSTSATKIIASLLSKMKAKSFCIHNSCLMAVIEHMNIKVQPSIVIVDLSSILNPFFQLGLDTKTFKELLKISNLENAETIELIDMYSVGKVNSKGNRLLYVVPELGSFTDYQIYRHNLKSYSVVPPFIDGAISIFKSKIDIIKVKFINQSNKNSRYKYYWELLIREDQLETVQNIDTETTFPTKRKIRDQIISAEHAHVVFRIPYFASATCLSEMEISGIKTTNNEYWIISNFLYNELKVYILEQAELIKFTPYTRSANKIETYIQTI